MSDIDCTLQENMEMDECMDMDMDHDMDDEHKGDMMTQVKWLMGSMMSATMYTLFIARYRRYLLGSHHHPDSLHGWSRSRDQPHGPPLRPHGLDGRQHARPRRQRVRLRVRLRLVR